MSNTRTPANRLAQETSPYLLQHAHNPVDWYPWGDEALARARREDRLILLSIGYSACHWCHVMERESFEDETIAALMNDHFVNIKVDREERPDLDDIYMAATVALNRGQGGWPMTVFLTPDLEPAFAGTYFPPEDMPGRPGFRRLLTEVARAWTEDRDGMVEKAGQLTSLLQRQRAVGPGLNVGLAELRQAENQFAEEFDETHGGFGSAPKFPPAVALMLLLRLHRRFGDERPLSMVRTTLDAMANGGLYDHIGGGFARYATDRVWLVPHFEKMLYDNALLTRSYLEAYQVTGEVSYRRVAVETLDYILREMTAPSGGFYSSTDADSEGEEGKFFVWEPDEIEQVLGAEDGAVFNAYYDITSEGNWEGVSIPRVRRALADVARQYDRDPATLAGQIEEWRSRVYAARQERVKPGLDDKVLTAWNGLMISACAEGYRILGDQRYLEAGRSAARFILDVHRQPGGKLLRTSRDGQAHLNGVLEDYAYLAEGLIDLYEAGGNRDLLNAASSIVADMIEEFGDDAHGAFYNTGVSHERLVMRFREGTDGATPSANAVATSALVRLALHLDRPAWRDVAARALKAYGSLIQRYPRGFAKSLCVVDFLLDEPIELAFVGDHDRTDALLREAAAVFLPNRIQAVSKQGDDDLPLLRGKDSVPGGAALYVCRNYTCEAPVTDPGDVRGRLEMSAAPQSRDTIAVRRDGAATPDGTARYRARFEADGYRAFADTGLVVSRLGFGGYRTDDETPGHRDALQRALSAGVNLIDTSTNYMDGGSERLIGSALGELIGNGDVRRDEVVVVSKIGYIQGATYDIARQREKEARAYPEVVKLGEGLWHCIHPIFLEEQLERSLDRLELGTLDVCLLHNPEYFLSYPPDPSQTADEVRTEFYRRLEVAFTFLENEVNRGRIQWYGVSSNTVAAPPDLIHATSLGRMLDAARRAGGDRHRFRVLQLPLNLFESDGTLSPGEDESDRPVLDVARDERLAVFANRPLNAFVEREMVRLGDFVTAAAVISVDDELQRVATLEDRFRGDLAATIRVPDGALDPGEFFRYHDELEYLVTQQIGLEQWSQVDHRIRSGIGRVVTALDRNLLGAQAEQWRGWRDEYLPVLQTLLAEFRRRAIAHAAERSQAVRRAIDPLFPTDRQDESLSRKALWTVASTPGVTSVLTGMRTTAYVEDALAILDWPPLDAPEEVYGAVRAAPYLPG